MAKIKSIYDAIVKTKVEEDQCTNFLVWLIGKLPAAIISQICILADIDIGENFNNQREITVQYPLENSRPDAVIESNNKYLIIETKRYPNTFNIIQFLNHHNGAIKEFGKDNFGLIFLSGDKDIPDELNKLIKQNIGSIGHISWLSLLELLSNNKKNLNSAWSIIIDEFLDFAKHKKLGRLIAMNNQEMQQFIDRYAELEKFRQPCAESLNKILDQYVERIIIDCEERMKLCDDDDDYQDELPCLYKSFNIKSWHTQYSSYVYINIIQKKVGICLTGYQEKKDINPFLELWNKSMKIKYKEDGELISFTWIEKDDDDMAINEGYFKIIEGTKGKIINPTQIPDLSESFYFGYIYDLTIDFLEEYKNQIGMDFKKMLDNFSPTLSIIRKNRKK